MPHDMTEKEFYSNPKRKKSRWLNFGLRWRDKNKAICGLFWYEKTGEVVAIREDEEPEYQIIGVEKSEPVLEKKLAGWMDVVGTISGTLRWVRTRLK